MSYLHPLRDKSEHATSKLILIAGHLLLAVTVLAVWPLPTFAEEDAVQSLRQQAEQGNADAQHILGFMYANGRGVPEDDAEAVRWYRKAAEQGNAGAQHILGFMYDIGDGVPEDDAEAVRWYRKAAEQGNAMAQSNLGLMYANGGGGAEG